MVSLRTRTYIIIKKTDKGSTTVVMSHEDYVRKVMEHVQEQKYYKKLTEDPTELFSSQIKGLLQDKVNRQSYKESMVALSPDNSKAFRFYVLPIIHKAGNPGRPSLSSCGTPTEGISCFVNYNLAPLVKKQFHHTSRTPQFIYQNYRAFQIYQQMPYWWWPLM